MKTRSPATESPLGYYYVALGMLLGMSIALLILRYMGAPAACGYCALLAAAGIAPCIHLIICARSSGAISKKPDTDYVPLLSSSVHLRGIRKAVKALYRIIGFPALVIVSALLYASVVLLWGVKVSFPTARVAAAPLFIVSCLGVVMGVGVGAGLYLLRLSTHELLRALRGPARLLLFLTVCVALVLGESIRAASGATVTPPWFTAIIPLWAAILCIEKILQVIAYGYLSSTAHSQADSCDSFVINSLAHPRGSGAAARATVKNLLGIDLSSRQFFAALRGVGFPALLLSLIIWLTGACLTIVQPGTCAIPVVMGRLSDRVLQCGLHVSMPWPLVRMRVINTDSVRTLHAGSHWSDSTGSGVFKEGLALLWTNMHGVRADELLLASAPRQLMHSASESGGMFDISRSRVPSVSLVGADVTVDYVVSDPRAYLLAGSNPDLHLGIIAQRCVSVHFLRYEIDELLSNVRSALIDTLKSEIQRFADSASLGLRVLHTGVTAVHPPLETAAAFEEKIAAFQEREISIDEARQNALRACIETAGNADIFRELVSRIELQESGHSVDTGSIDSLLGACDGDISRLLAAARGYRWVREHSEGGMAERFAQESAIHHAAPNVYKKERYYAALAEGLAGKNKILLDRDPSTVTFIPGTGSGAAAAAAAMPQMGVTW